MTERCEDVTVAAHVVQTRTSVNVGDVLQEDTKFPAGIGKRGKGGRGGGGGGGGIDKGLGRHGDEILHC